MLPGIAGIAGMVASASGPALMLHDQSVSASAPATYQIGSDGNVYGAGFLLETWLPAGASATSYQVLAALIDGDAPTGSSLSTWLSCTSSRSWSMGRFHSGTIQVSIRDAAVPNTMRASALISIAGT